MNWWILERTLIIVEETFNRTRIDDTKDYFKKFPDQEILNIDNYYVSSTWFYFHLQVREL